IPANIVEGRARSGQREFRHFLDTSWASLAEVEYTLRFAHDLGYLTDEGFERLSGLATAAARPLYGLLRSMRKA
ncbi:MAG: four helix bundle protein, partial [Gemmatimonadales bacterium]